VVSRAPFIASALTLCVVLAGCQPGGETPSNDAPLATGDFVGIAWPSAERLVLARLVPDQPGGTRIGSELLTVEPVTGSVKSIDLPLDPGCDRERYLNPDSFGANAVTFIHACTKLDAGGEPHSVETIGSVTLDSSTVATIVALSSLTGSTNVSYSVDSIGHRTFYAIGASICSGIAIATDDVKEGRLHVDVAGDGKSFNLDTPADLHGPCDGAGRAGGPALSPNVQELAFAASPASVGLSGAAARLAAPVNLYILDTASNNVRLLVPGIAGGGSISWSPNGTLLSYLHADQGKQPALWVVERLTGQSRKVADGDFRWTAWSPDGRQIAAVRHISADAQPFAGEVVILDVEP
jgi:hypothetical protein